MWLSLLNMKVWQVALGIFAVVTLLYFLRKFYMEGFVAADTTTEAPLISDVPTFTPEGAVHVDGSTEAPQMFSAQDISLAGSVPEVSTVAPAAQEVGDYMAFEETPTPTPAAGKRKGFHLAL